MLNANTIGQSLKELQFHIFTGVPCSFLKNLINYAVNECHYIGATNEGEAVAIAAGAHIGGAKSVVIMQNSGLTNAISPLVSLNEPFKIPVLGFVSLRGEEGIGDEPQHKLMGKITTSFLDLMNVKWDYLSTNETVAIQQIERANQFIEKGLPFFFVVKKGTFVKEDLLGTKQPMLSKRQIVRKKDIDQIPTRFQVLETINQLKDHHTIQLATTGKTGRELYEIEDSSNNLYMVGSMGCVSSLGLGVALTQKNKEVIVLDGDGSLLMRMGSLATNGTYGPSNMLHILIDNGSHDSTGGQRTVSDHVDFVSIAHSCGYHRSIYVHNLTELINYIKEWKKAKQLTFLYVKIAKGSKKALGRPKLTPFEVKQRLKQFLLQ